MATPMPQLTRQLASDMTDLDQVESVEKHNGSVGSVDFLLKEDSVLSANRISRKLPEGWTVTIVVTDDTWTTAYIERE